MKNIVLVGFMGTGKTTIGKMVAERSGMRYFSVDSMIEAKEGTTIEKIFAEKGEAYFRALEKETIVSASNEGGAVIDAGGGAVLKGENVSALKSNGIMFCLWAEPEDIYNRTKKFSHRPLLNVADPLARIKELLEKRKPYYEAADHHVNTSEVSVEAACDYIIRVYKGACNG